LPKTAKTLSGTKPESRAAEALPLRHVAIIMDGNRRWADQRGLPRLVGHREGVKALKETVKHATTQKLEYLTVYAFSSENWHRSHDEIDYLMKLFNEVLSHELEELAKGGARLRFIGDLSGMPTQLQFKLAAAMTKTQENSGLKLQVALNYGSRLEITQAIKEIVNQVKAGKITEQAITPELVQNHLFTAGIPDPELMIRTGGEMRLSNYLLWQSAYTELYITPVLWPDFSPKEFDEAIKEFTLRKRRYGGD